MESRRPGSLALFFYAIRSGEPPALEGFCRGGLEVKEGQVR
ncbi:hypothetical protein KNP414_05438 [Paenibacillus mucilaginosus KNP414]|uniref:Uncharacterized protein n=1 Tax=Paenibacillus mucilaginosus (strain KNP414) TaxID=1036673 RepID=F8FI59_PAEMK|nr:hypothetical protein KNP414_05438 [Paenibacillus mucilaginosus KNP414]